jgi:hypothetical protein
MYHVMVMDLLGKSLEDLFQECRHKFDLKTILHISHQMVSAASKKLHFRFKGFKKFTRKELYTGTSSRTTSSSEEPSQPRIMSI